MSSWLSLAWPLVVALSALFLPGALIGAAARLRPMYLVTTAPLVSVAVVAGSGVICGLLGVPWGWAAVAVSAVIAAVLVGGTRIALLRTAAPTRTGAPRTRQPRWATAVALVVGLVVTFATVVVQFMRPTASPSNIGQYQDTMFHLDVVRYILTTHDGSSLDAGRVDGSVASSTFYPSGWHDTVALIASGSGASIPAAAAAMTVALLAFVLPLGMAGLAVALFGVRPSVIVSAMALSAVPVAFPWRFLIWGQLYSNQLGLALTPAFIALVLLICSRHLERDRFWPALLLAIAGFGALALAQPNTIFGATVLLAPYAVPFVWSRLPDDRRRASRAAWIYALLAVVAVLGWLTVYRLPFMQRTVTWRWDSFETSSQAFGEFVTNGFNGSDPQLLFSALTLVGIVAVVARRRHLWLVFSWAGFGLLYVLSAGAEGRIRNLLTGFWYHDSYRLAAFAAFTAVPLATYGVLTVIEGVRKLFSRFAPANPRQAGAVVRSSALPGLAVATAVGVVLAGVNLAEPAMRETRATTAHVFSFQDGYMLTSREQSFLKRVAGAVPAGDVIANNPYDGSGLGYALYGTDYLFPAMDGNWLGTWGAAQRVVASELDAVTDHHATVCRALHDLNVDYVVQLEPKPYSANGTAPEWSGLRIPKGTPGFTPVLSDGDMSLYRIDACSAG